MTISAGSKLGPYEIITPLGAGGMGEVWKARDTRLDREVAIKILPPGFAENEQLRARFEREAKAISSLNHPNICTLFDVGHEGGTHYLVMELIEGDSLADRVTKGPLPLDQVLRYGAQIADALDRAHKQGIVHRDLKPGNIMVTKTGAKLLDFGLAHVTAESRPLQGLTEMPTEARPLTAEGTILGTFQYMAPEQLEGMEPDARTDIFALGAVLYEMATGQRAFRGSTRTSLIAAIVSAQPEPISTVTKVTPPALDHVVRKCLEKDPEDRWQSAHDISSELRWVSEAGSQAGVAAPVSVRRRTRERLAWTLAAALAISTMTLGWLASKYRKIASDRPVIQTSIVAPEGVNFAFVALGGPPELSPDGKAIVFGADDADGKNLLYVRRLDSTEFLPLPGTEDAWYPFWSADSLSIAFFADGKLKRVPASGGPVTTICEAPNGRGGTWSEDGRIVVGLLNSSLYKVPSGGGELAPVTEVEEGVEHRWPWMIPGTDRFVYFEDKGAAGTEIRTGSLDGSVDVSIVESDANPAWADGHLLYTVQGTLMAQALDPDTFARVGDPIPLAENVMHDRNFARSMFSVSRTGLLAYYTGTTRSRTVLTWFDRQGEKVGTLGKEDVFLTFRISPDGKAVAVSVEDEAVGTEDIWIYETTRDVRTRLTFDPAREYDPLWSRDGETMFFYRLGSGTMRCPVSGVGEAELLDSDRELSPSALTPDGKTLVASRWVGNFDVVAYTLGDGKEARTLFGSDFHEYPWGLSPDGTYLLYGSNESGTNEIYVTTFPEPSGKWQISVGGARGARWSPDGKEIFYSVMEPVRIMSVSLGSGLRELGEPRLVMTIPEATTESFYWDLSPDGKRFLLKIPSDPNHATRSPITLITNWEGLLGK